MERHYFCSHCLISIDLKTMKNCPNTFCNKDLTKKGSTSFFIEFPVVKQLRNLFHRENFLTNLKKKRFKRKKKNADAIEDIYAGVLY